MKLHYIFILLLLPFFGKAQSNLNTAQAFQDTLTATFLNVDKTPLNETELKDFKGITFFTIDPKFVVTARLEVLENQRPFLMPTTGSVKKRYKKYGILHFEIDGKALKLNVYQNLELIKQEGYANHLFLPFFDLTSGVTTYGGGRYMDLEIPSGNVITLDFNTAYNPYCAYSVRYSCPITPNANFLDVEIKAGVTYDNHEI